MCAVNIIIIVTLQACFKDTVFHQMFNYMMWFLVNVVPVYWFYAFSLLYCIIIISVYFIDCRLKAICRLLCCSHFVRVKNQFFGNKSGKPQPIQTKFTYVLIAQLKGRQCLGNMGAIGPLGAKLGLRRVPCSRFCVLQTFCQLLDSRFSTNFAAARSTWIHVPSKSIGSDFRKCFCLGVIPPKKRKTQNWGGIKQVPYSDKSTTQGM